MARDLLTNEQKNQLITKVREIQKCYPNVVHIAPKNTVTDEDIVYIEKELNIELPQDYVWFLKTFGEIHVLVSMFGYPLHINGVTTLNGKKIFSVIDETNKFRNGFTDDLVNELEYDLSNIVSIDTNEEDFQRLLSIDECCVLDVEYYCEVDSSESFGTCLVDDINDIYNNLMSDSFKENTGIVSFVTPENNQFILSCYKDRDFTLDYSKNNKLEFVADEPTMIDALKHCVIVDKNNGVKAFKELYHQTISLKTVTTYSMTTMNLSKEFNVNLSEFDDKFIGEHGNVANRLQTGHCLGTVKDERFIVFNRFYDIQDMFTETLHGQYHEDLPDNLIILGVVNETDQLTYHIKNGNISLFSDGKDTLLAQSLSDYLKALQSDTDVPDDVKTSDELVYKLKQRVGDSFFLASDTHLFTTGYFGSYCDCGYSIERLNNIWLVFFSERGHVFRVTVFSSSDDVIANFIKQKHRSDYLNYDINDEKLNQFIGRLTVYKDYNRNILEKENAELVMSNGISWLLFNKETIKESLLAYKVGRFRKNKDVLMIGQEGDNCLLAVFTDNHIEFVVNELGNLDEEDDIIIDHTPNAFYQHIDYLNIYEFEQTINQKRTLDDIKILLNLMADEIENKTELSFLIKALQADIKTIKHTVFNQLNLHLLIMSRMVVDNNLSDTTISYQMSALYELQKQFNESSQPLYLENKIDMWHYVKTFDTQTDINQNDSLHALLTYLKIFKFSLVSPFILVIALNVFRLLQKILHIGNYGILMIVALAWLIVIVGILVDLHVSNKINQLNTQFLNNGLLTRKSLVYQKFLSELDDEECIARLVLPSKSKLIENEYVFVRKLECIGFRDEKSFTIKNCTVRIVNQSGVKLICYKTEVGTKCFTLNMPIQRIKIQTK